MKAYAFLVMMLSGVLLAHAADPDLAGLQDRLDGAKQVIVVVPADGFAAQIFAYEFHSNDGHWAKVLGPFRATVGAKGFATPGAKREGDHKTPSGIYAIGDSFGYAETLETKLRYRQTGSEDFWVDDPDSPQYNQWVHGKPDARSVEVMHRKDWLYSAGIIVEYNTSPVVKGAGSAIFLHVWRSEQKPTAGCVAMEDANLRSILRWLDPEQKPKVILNPAALR